MELRGMARPQPEPLRPNGARGLAPWGTRSCPRCAEVGERAGEQPLEEQPALVLAADLAEPLPTAVSQQATPTADSQPRSAIRAKRKPGVQPAAAELYSSTASAVGSRDPLAPRLQQTQKHCIFMRLLEEHVAWRQEALVVTSHSDPEAAARAVLARPGCLAEWCVVKMGGQGALLCRRAGAVEREGQPEAVAGSGSSGSEEEEVAAAAVARSSGDGIWLPHGAGGNGDGLGAKEEKEALAVHTTRIGALKVRCRTREGGQEDLHWWHVHT